MEEIGKIIHYFANIGVAVIEITGGDLRVGDRIRISGHTTDFEQAIESMEIERKRVDFASPFQSVAIKVDGQVRENDEVFKVN